MSRLLSGTRKALRLFGSRAVQPWYLSGTAFANSLVGYWKLDEASGNAIDYVGSSTLTDNNTVTSNTGIIYALAREFVIANSESLSVADNATLSTGDIDFWAGVWARPASVTAVTSTIIGKWTTGGNQREWHVNQQNAGVNFQVSPDGTSTGVTTVSAAGVLAVDTWVFLMAYHDSTNNLLGLSVNGAAFSTAAHTTGAIDGTSTFRIGAHSAGTSFFGGRIQAAYFGKSYIPSDSDASYLYNGGAGRT